MKSKLGWIAKMDTLDAIRVFLRVVETGSFSAAARERGVGQSAISKQIASLETRLGTPLLLRSSRSLTVTDAGRKFYAGAGGIADDYAELEASLRDDLRSPTGLVRVAVAPVFGRLYLLPHLHRFFELYPGVRVEVHASERNVSLVEDGIDLAIRHGDLSDSSITARRLAVSPFVTVASAKYFARHGTPETPDDLKQHQCIVLSRRQDVRPWGYLMPSGQQYLHEPEGRFLTSDAEQIRAAALENLGIAHVPDWLVKPELRSGALLPVLTSYQSETYAISALFHGRKSSAACRALLEFMATTLGEELRLLTPTGN